MLFAFFGYVSSLLLLVLGAIKLIRIFLYRKYLPVRINSIEFGVETVKENQVFVLIDVFYPRITYTYIVNGKVYTGSSENIKKYFKDENMDNILKLNEEIKHNGIVYYNPRNNEEFKSILIKPGIALILKQSSVFISGILILIVMVALNGFN